MKPILSNDPQAIEKLEIKLKQLEDEQERMKTVNKLYKKHGREVFNMIELSDASRQNIEYNIAQSYYNDTPYPKFYLTNNSAVIRQTKKRIDKLTKSNFYTDKFGVLIDKRGE